MGVPGAKRPGCKMPLRQSAHSRSTGSLPMFDGSKGAAIALRPAVQQRWEKAHAARTMVDELGSRGRVSQPDFPCKRCPLPGDADEDSQLPAFKKALEARLFRYSQCPTFPVPKYRTFSQSEPYNLLDGRGETFVEPEEKAPKLPHCPVPKYFSYSCPMQERSPHIIIGDSSHGLSKSRSKTWVFGEQ